VGEPAAIKQGGQRPMVDHIEEVLWIPLPSCTREYYRSKQAPTVERSFRSDPRGAAPDAQSSGRCSYVTSPCFKGLRVGWRANNKHDHRGPALGCVAVVGRLMAFYRILVRRRQVSLRGCVAQACATYIQAILCGIDCPQLPSFCLGGNARRVSHPSRPGPPIALSLRITTLPGGRLPIRFPPPNDISSRLN